MSQGNPSVGAVIVGGGSGTRFGGEKLTEVLAGKPLLAHTLAAFEASPDIAAVVLVVPSGDEGKFRAIARDTGIGKLHAVIAGGAHRHESVLKGLNALPPAIDFAAIHDAARPLVTPELIGRVVRAAQEHGAAALAAPVTDTLQQVDGEGNAAATVDRSSIRAMQTPQVFRKEQIVRLLSEAPGLPTDEVSVAMAAGRRVFLVEHSEPNLKVTWPQDLVMAEALLCAREGKGPRS